MKDAPPQLAKPAELEDDEPGEASAPSAIAREVKRIKDETILALERRERLPQPLFWSLFGHAIGRVKQKKRAAREARELLEGIDEA